MLEYKSHGENFRTHRCRCVLFEGYLGFWGFCRWMILSPEASQSKPPTIRWTNNIDSEGNKQESYVGINWIIVGSASVAQQLPIESCTEFLWDLRIISGHTLLQAPSSPENSWQKFKIVTYWYFGGCLLFLFTECLFSNCMFSFWGEAVFKGFSPWNHQSWGVPKRFNWIVPFEVKKKLLRWNFEKISVMLRWTPNLFLVTVYLKKP